MCGQQVASDRSADGQAADLQAERTGSGRDVANGSCLFETWEAQLSPPPGLTSPWAERHSVLNQTERRDALAG